VGKTWVTVTELSAVQLFTVSAFLNVLITSNLHTYVLTISVQVLFLQLVLIPV